MAKETTTENATEDTLVFDSMPGGDKKDPQGTDSFTVDLDFSEDTTTEDIDPVATEEQEVEEILDPSTIQNILQISQASRKA